MKNALPIIIIIASLCFLFQDKVRDIFLPNEKGVVVDETEISDVLKQRVTPIVDIVKKSKTNKAIKNKAASLWKASGDMWALSDADFNSNDLVDFNKELLLLYGKKYPELTNSFPGFGESVNTLFKETLGEYPTPMSKEKLKELSDLCYGIAWAFEN